MLDDSTPSTRIREKGFPRWCSDATIPLGLREAMQSMLGFALFASAAVIT